MAPAGFVFGFVVVVVGALGAPAAVEAAAAPRAKYLGSRFRAAKRGWSARRGGASGRVVIVYLSRLGWVGLWGAHALGVRLRCLGGRGRDAVVLLPRMGVEDR